jgi:hypothetical protein
VDIIFSALSGTNQKELQVLNLEDNKIGHASVYALCKFLQYNHSLTDLNLANNKFREDDGKVRPVVCACVCVVARVSCACVMCAVLLTTHVGTCR